MRKPLLFILLFVSSLLSAQQQAIITQTDGTKLIIPVWKIDNISFQDSEKLDAPAPPSAVDLGLKSGILWSPWNIGATSETEVGFLLGWGNHDSTNLSTDLKYFPTPTATKNISNTEFDVAKYYWGSDDPLWHMPTLEDFQELMSLKWEWDAEKRAYKISNPDAEDESVRENYIYLPVTGQRIGEAEADSTDFGFYWSGSVAKNDSASYLRTTIDESGDNGGNDDEEQPVVDGDEENSGEDVDEPDVVAPTFWQLLNGFRARHFAVRPVYGKYRVPVTVSSDDAEVEHLQATITVTVEGQADNVKYYIIYSKVDDLSESTAYKSEEYSINALDGTFKERVTIKNLEYDTKYFYRVVAVVGPDMVEENATHEFVTEPDNRIVDLGLSVKWARWNVGAEAENEVGYHVRWGALNETDNYYNEAVDISGNPLYDIATSEWGGEWRMPTKEEYEELIKYCKVELDNVGGINGVRFSRNGDSIFMPFGGIRSGSRIGNHNTKGFYWISSGYSAVAEFLKIEDVIYSDWYLFHTYEKGLGLTVRPVYGKNDKNNFIVNPDDPNNDDPNNDDPNNDDPNNNEEPENPRDDVEMVDLGLTSGTLWANKNIGAESVSDYGSFYAWGETETKSTYLLTNYSHYNEGYDTFDSPYRGVKGIQGTEQDVAHIQWEGDWVIPSPTQFEELVDECTWEWNNAVPGYKVKSKKNSNYIFLPTTGYYSGSSRTAQIRGYYWTSSLYLFPADWNKAKQAMEFVIAQAEDDADKHYQVNAARQNGLAIRPVILTK
ncbi:MAG: fibronectin type III domain-containing protein [Bacteroidaceae bacterium]|nr:fibronectin type III domain-containing protein [Bacteroidaceae bacterium]